MRISFMNRFFFWICISRLAASTNSFPDDSFSIGGQSSRRLEDAPDYYTLSSGNCTVPIASAAECQEAAVAMGYVYGNPIAYPTAPHGCLVAYGQQVVYNTEGGPCSLLGDDAKCLCANTFHPTSLPTRTFSPTHGPTSTLSPTMTMHPTVTYAPSNYPTTSSPSPLPTGSNDRYGIKFDTYTLRGAVSVWCSNETLARAIYGDIKDWDTSRVTDMSRLFSMSDEDDDAVAGLYYYCSSYETFNGDISAWNRKSLRIN